MVVSTHPSNTRTVSPPKKKRGASSSEDRSNWLTRDQVTDMLGISHVTLVALERKGELHSERHMRTNRAGHQQLMYVFNPHEVAAIPTRHSKVIRTPGEIAARAFEHFREGLPLHEIVIELRESPDLIEQLHEKWLNMQGADLVIAPSAKEAFEKLFGPFRGVAELLELVTQKLTR